MYLGASQQRRIARSGSNPALTPLRLANPVFEPLCGQGHGDCATMRQAWDQLGGIYNYSHAVSVAEVDCSRFVHHPPEEDGTIRSRESLCQRYDIKSYPTVLYFTGETGTTGANYTGKHTFDAMHSFLESEREKLYLLDHEKGLKALEPGPACGPEEVKFLEQWRERPPEEALAELERLEAIVSNRAVRERTHAHVISCVGAHHYPFLFAGDLWRVQADVDGQAHQPAQADTRRAQAGRAKDGALKSRVDDAALHLCSVVCAVS